MTNIKKNAKRDKEGGNTCSQYSKYHCDALALLKTGLVLNHLFQSIYTRTEKQNGNPVVEHGFGMI